MKSFTCRDVGMECDWKAQGKSEQEVLDQIKVHAESKHNIKSMATDMVDQVKAKITDLKAA